jgi:hypothetical protein
MGKIKATKKRLAHSLSLQIIFEHLPLRALIHLQALYRRFYKEFALGLIF